jgi:hypothetical protein
MLREFVLGYKTKRTAALLSYRLPGRVLAVVEEHPMPTLRSSLDSLAQSFASNVLAAIRGASLQELLAESGGAPRRGPGRPRGSSTKSTPTAARASAPATSKAKTKGGRLARRSPADIARALDAVVILVRKSKTGMRSEEIRKALKLDVREVPRVLKEGLSKKKLRSKGQKRATTYTAG